MENTEIFLDKRLKTIAEFAKKGCTFADIGTDHGFLPAYLVLCGIAKGGFACDINEMPLDKARNLIIGEKLTEKIHCILCDGVPNELEGKIDTVIIAGMGGETIIHILENAKWLNDEKMHFIFQPMTKIKELRRYLLENGFEIEKEKGAVSGKFAYSVLSCYFTGNKKTMPEEYYYVGECIKESDPDSKAYIQRVLRKLSSVENGMTKAKSTSPDLEKVQCLIEKIKAMEGRG
ncbi:MAG: class I SAM-dependent methyltransferase [Oscillospiraceae bacterium]